MWTDKETERVESTVCFLWLANAHKNCKKSHGNVKLHSL